MEQHELILLSLVAIVAVVGVVSVTMSPAYTVDVEEYEVDADDSATGYVSGIEGITGNKIRIKKPKFVKQIQKEAARVEKRVEKEVARTDDNLKKGIESATEKIKAEGRRFDRKTFRPLGDKIDAEADRFGERVQAEWDRTDDNLKEIFGDKIKAELKRIEDRANAELDRQLGPLVDLVKGDICGVTESTVVQELINTKLKPMFMSACTPIAQGAVQALASPLQAIPYVGPALYAIATQVVPQKVCEKGFKRVIKEARKKCEEELPEEIAAPAVTPQPTPTG